jgi:hypothetical protein
LFISTWIDSLRALWSASAMPPLMSSSAALWPDSVPPAAENVPGADAVDVDAHRAAAGAHLVERDVGRAALRGRAVTTPEYQIVGAAA